MLTGLDRNEIAIMCVASLLCLIVMAISYFCLELREAWVRQRGRAGGFESSHASGFISGQTTGPMPAIDNFPACADNCCSASIVPP